MSQRLAFLAGAVWGIVAHKFVSSDFWLLVCFCVLAFFGVQLLCFCIEHTEYDRQQLMQSEKRLEEEVAALLGCVAAPFVIYGFTALAVHLPA